MRRGPAALLCVTLAIGCGRETPVQPEIVDASTISSAALATLTQLRGTVTLERGGQARPATAGPLLRGDVLSTGSASAATVQFTDGRIVEVDADGRLVIDTDASGVVLALSAGHVLSRVPQGASGSRVSLTISTPFGVTRIGQSEVGVGVKNGGAQVDVKMGTAEILSRNGATLRVGAGDGALLSASGVSRPIALKPIEVFLSGGHVELRKKGARAWKHANPGIVVESGDSLRAAHGGSLKLTERSDVLAAPGSELTLVHAERDGAQARAQLELAKGELTFNARGEGTRLALGGISLSSDGGRFSVARRNKQLEVDAIVGDVTVERNGLTQRLSAGQTARVGSSGAPMIDERPVSPVALPARNGTRVYAGASADVTLTWEATGDSHVQIATDAAFEDLLADGIVHQPRVTLPAPRRGALHWRVLGADGKEAAHGSALFAPEAAVAELERPRNEVADGAEQTTIFYQDKAPAVTFTFKPDPKAARYRLSVFKADNLQRAAIERTATTTAIPLEAGSLSEGRFFWSVTPLSAKGEPLRGGKLNKLELAYDNSVPNLLVLSPKNGELAGAKVRAAGVAPVGTRLTINGRPATLDGKNRFDVAVTPIGRPPLVIFRLSRPPAADALTLRVLRKR